MRRQPVYFPHGWRHSDGIACPAWRETLSGLSYGTRESRQTSGDGLTRSSEEVPNNSGWGEGVS